VSRVPSRSSALGTPEDLLTALRACATNALHPIVGDALASDGFVITPALLRDLHTAARDKPFDVSVGGGVGIPFGSHPDVALDGPFFSGAAQGTCYPFKHVGFGLSTRFDYQRSQTQGTLFFGDISGEGGFVNDDTTSEAEVLAGALMVQATVRTQEGVLLPYVRGGIGAGLLSIALGDVLPSRNDLPLFLARQREAGTSLAAVVEGTVGVELIAIDPLQLRAELTLFSYLNDLQARSFVGGQDKSDAAEITAVPVGPVGGVSLQLAIGFQG